MTFSGKPSEPESSKSEERCEEKLNSSIWASGFFHFTLSLCLRGGFGPWNLFVKKKIYSTRIAWDDLGLGFFNRLLSLSGP